MLTVLNALPINDGTQINGLDGLGLPTPITAVPTCGTAEPGTAEPGAAPPGGAGPRVDGVERPAEQSLPRHRARLLADQLPPALRRPASPPNQNPSPSQRPSPNQRPSPSQRPVPASAVARAVAAAGTDGPYESGHGLPIFDGLTAELPLSLRR